MMNVFALISALAALAHVFMAAMVWFHDRKSPINRLATVTFSLTGLYFWIQHHQRSAGGYDEALLWLQAQCVMYPTLVLYVHFVTQWITPERHVPRWLNSVTWSCALVMMYLHVAENALGKPFWDEDLSMWLVRPDDEGVLRTIAVAWISLVLVGYAGRVAAAMLGEHRDDESRRRARIMLVGVMGPAVMTVLLDNVLIALLGFKLPTFTAISFTLGSAIIIRAMSQGHFFVMSAATASALLDATSEALVITDPRGGILSVNPAMEGLVGSAEAELKGKTLCTLFSHGPIGPGCPLRPLHGAEATVLAQQGVEIRALLSVDPVHDSSERVRGWICVVRDITERAARSARERAARLAAEEATRAKSQFLANMSHEIRTPMNGVIGMTSLLSSTSLDEYQRELLNTLQGSSEVLLAILNDVLDLSKIEANCLELEQTGFCVRDAVEQSLVLLAGAAAKKSIVLGYILDPEIPDRLIGDPVRFRQVLVNLLSNAVKFTEAGSVTVRVELARASSDSLTLQIAVTDTGVGIAHGRIQELFEPFTQADSSTTRRFGGTGLGLAICRQLVELMHGSIWAESALGLGSTFSFTCQMQVSSERPVEGPASPSVERVLVLSAHPVVRQFVEQCGQAWQVEVFTAADVEAACLMLDTCEPELLITDCAAELSARLSQGLPVIRLVSTLPAPGEHPMDGATARLTFPMRFGALRRAIGLVVKPGGRLNQTPPPPQPKPVPAALRVLVVEDHPVNQKVALRMLTQLGVEADLAEHGEAALQAVSARPYDVVLMDVQMPVMDGLEATRLIRARGFEQLRIVAMTANATPEDRRACLEAGMNDYITKPVRPAILRGALWPEDIEQHTHL
ncbi:MAG: response regulator [Bradymonadia bacterium]